MGPDAMISVFWMLNFTPAFSFSSSKGSLVPLHFLPEWWHHLHIWGYWYFPGNLDSSLSSSSPAFLMMYSAYKLNKHGEIQMNSLANPILSRDIHVPNGRISWFFSNDWVVSHCVYTPDLIYSFVCQCTGSLLPYLGNCK